eukprot:gene9790-biopygen12256
MWDHAECQAPLKAGVLHGSVVSGCVAGLLRGLVAPVTPHCARILQAPAAPHFFIRPHPFSILSVAVPAALHYAHIFLRQPAHTVPGHGSGPTMSGLPESSSQYGHPPDIVGPPPPP